jgi:hypothetical protein
LDKKASCPEWPGLCCQVGVFWFWDPATSAGARSMDRNDAKGPFLMERLWNELTILRGVLIVFSILFLVLAFCPP